jgi:hypothetical protein
LAKLWIYVLLLFVMGIWLANVRYDDVAHAVMAFSAKYKD